MECLNWPFDFSCLAVSLRGCLRFMYSDVEVSVWANKVHKIGYEAYVYMSKGAIKVDSIVFL